jgi:hypothetical protein
VPFITSWFGLRRILSALAGFENLWAAASALSFAISALASALDTGQITPRQT